MDTTDSETFFSTVVQSVLMVLLLVLPEPDAGRRNALRLEDLSDAARQSDAYYQEAEFDRAAEDLARAAGALAYGQDRGLWQTGELTLRAAEILHGEAVEI